MIKLLIRLMLILISIGSIVVLGFEYYSAVALPTFAFQRDSKQNGVIYYLEPSNINLIWDKVSQRLEVAETSKPVNIIEFELSSLTMTKEDFETAGFAVVALNGEQFNLLPNPDCRYVALVLDVRSATFKPSQSFRNISCEMNKRIKNI